MARWTATPEERFWGHVQKTETCWLWVAALNNKGYGKFLSLAHGPGTYAHRFSWMLHYGPIPQGLCVLHKCDVPRCIRPDHLFLGTHKDNMRDMVAKGRVVQAPANRRQAELKRAQTHCKYNHPLSGNNLAFSRRGQRRCRACRTIHSREYKRRRRASHAVS